VFCNGRLPANLKFTYNNRDLEWVPNFSYLGIAFSKSGTFNTSIKDLVNKGTKAMYVSSWHCIDKLWILPFFNTSYIAFVPLFTRSFIDVLNDPDLENVIPR
jgi:hypothetical protein